MSLFSNNLPLGVGPPTISNMENHLKFSIYLKPFYAILDYKKSPVIFIVNYYNYYLKGHIFKTFP